jgi:voltage-gated potassium channel
MNSRSFLKEAFDNPRSRLLVAVNDFLAFVTIVSVLSLILETVQAFHTYALYFRAVEYLTVGLFTFEYLARLYIAKLKSAYVFSFYGAIDLLAILPTFFGLGNLTFLKTARALRILRFLRILRLTKLARVGEKRASSLYVLNIQIYAVALATALLILGGLAYLFEGDKPYAQDLPSSMFWAFKVIFGGISYQQPETAVGIAILIVARFVSMILLGLMLGLVATLMRKVLIGSEKDA